MIQQQQQLSQVTQILLTSGLTITGGLFVLVVGQVVIKFIIEPIQEQAKTIGKIASDLIYYANIYTNPGLGDEKELNDASKALRQHASQLRGQTQAIPWYRFWSMLGFVPTRDNVIKASANLISLSNTVFHKQEATRTAISNEKSRKETLKLLRLEDIEA